MIFFQGAACTSYKDGIFLTKPEESAQLTNIHDWYTLGSTDFSHQQDKHKDVPCQTMTTGCQ
jgi:hypothetical protein